MDLYSALLNMPAGTDDIESLFKTLRPNDPSYPGSTYAHHSDNKTTGYRAPSNMPGTPHEIQPSSFKTVYLTPENSSIARGAFRDTNISTYAQPEINEKGKSTGHLLIRSLEDQKAPSYRSKKDGRESYKKDEVISKVPYSARPQVGLQPVEFGKSASSPKGSSGDAHWGNSITEVFPRPQRLSGSGSAPLMDRPPMGGDRNILHNLNPLALMKASGGVVKMPEHYSQGGWKLI
jgi:hypothetical protein